MLQAMSDLRVQGWAWKYHVCFGEDMSELQKVISWRQHGMNSPPHQGPKVARIGSCSWSLLSANSMFPTAGTPTNAPTIGNGFCFATVGITEAFHLNKKYETCSCENRNKLTNRRVHVDRCHGWLPVYLKQAKSTRLPQHSSVVRTQQQQRTLAEIAAPSLICC